MTNPTDEELDAAVVKVLGRLWCATNLPSWVLDGDIHLDWNALMAAKARLKDYVFDCRGGADTSKWWCSHIRIFWSHEEEFDPRDSESEARALALCIHAVVNQ